MNIAEPKDVLVVFKRDDPVSVVIKDYYVEKRNIPEINIVKEGGVAGLSFEGDNGIILANSGEVIKRDAPCSDYGGNGFCDNLAWQYYIDEIATPIAEYLNNTYDSSTGLYLKDQIRYIVLCKGIPIKIESGDYSWVGSIHPLFHFYTINVSIDGLLCLLNNNNNNQSVLAMYPPFTPATAYRYYRSWVTNPYFGADAELNFNYRFKSNHFQSTHIINILEPNIITTWKLAYLVSRLDGRNLEEVIDLIDNSFTADHSGEGKWIIDTHEFYPSDFPPGSNQSVGYNIYNNWSLTGTVNMLNNLGFNVLSDNNLRDSITTSNEPIIGYVSWGQHAKRYPHYITTTNNFDYLPGALFNSIESYNGFSMNPDNRISDQGLVSEFIQMTGTAGSGHTYEPQLYKNNESYYSFPAYAMGYGVVDAMYQGIPKLGWQNIVVGDPLTTIAWGKQTLTANTEWDGTNLVTGKITVPQNKTLTIIEDAVINFRHLGSLEIDGYLIIEKGAKLNFHNGGQLVVNNGIKISGASNKYVEIDFISPNSTTENGIILNESAIEDTLIYIKIKNAYRGITVNEKTFYINYAEITNCETGMYLYKSDYQLTINEGTKVLNSEISSNQTGIYLNESSPQFISNIISGNNNAIEMINESAPVFGEYLEPGVNTFSANDYNILAISAFPTLGANFSGNIGEDYVGGFNEFTGTSLQFVSVDDNGYVLAEINWWDGSPPDPNMFEEIKGTIDYDPWLDNPSSPLNAGGKGNNSVFVSGNSNTYDKILIDIAKNDIASAWRSIKIKLNDSPSIFGIHLLKTIAKSSELTDSAKSVMQQISSGSNPAQEIKDYAKLSLINKRGNSNFVSQLNQTANIIQNKNVKGLALFKLFSHYYFSSRDKENANNVINRMKMASLSEKWITEAERLLGNYQPGNNQNMVNNNHGTGNEIIIGNYPNPFNPLTNINFNLPERNLVELTVYNILGQKVVTLKNEVMEAGSYSVQFDATQLPSGVYVYRLTSGGFTNSKKMLFLK